jgi:hypothetical protein
MMFLSIRAENHRNAACAYLDVLQLDRKIKAGEIKQLIVREFEIVAIDRAGDCKYTTRVVDDSVRGELLTDANEVVDGHTRVDLVTKEANESPVPPPIAIGTGLGFMVLMVVHLGTILLMIALMPFYIVLAVNNPRLEQTMRIVWVVLLCTVGLIANPVYWYLYVWRKPKPSSANESI